jgi:hypothetical protein
MIFTSGPVTVLNPATGQWETVFVTSEWDSTHDFSAVDPNYPRRSTTRIASCGLAHFRKLGYCAIEGSGTLVTVPYDGADGNLRLNAKPLGPGGRVLAELRDMAGSPIGGRSFANCRAIDIDHTHRTVSWPNAGPWPAGRTVRFAFKLENAALYSFECGEAMREAA